MARQLRTVERASITLIGALALAATTLVTAAPAALGASHCQVRNVTQDTVGHQFEAMVDAAEKGDRLRVQGLCAASAVIRRDLTIRGVGHRAILDGEYRGRVLQVRRGAVVTLQHLVLKHGKPGGGINSFPQGGGIYSRGTLTLIDSVVFANVGAYDGGGIYNAGTLRLIRTTVSRHGRVYWIDGTGGGIYNSGTATLVDSTVTDNHAKYHGGGILNTGTLTLKRSTVSDNDYWSVLEGPGAGMANYGTLILIDSSVTGNHGYQGAGISNFRRREYPHELGDGIVVMTRSTVSGNSAAGSAGGIYNSGTLVLTDSAVTANSAGSAGGGIFNTRFGTVLVDDASSVTGNDPDDCVGTPAC